MTAFIDPRLADWLASGDVGSSSKAIMLWLSARRVAGTWGADTPSDAGDLGRCLRLLDRIPEWKPRIGEMAEAGGLWPTFTKHWAEIEQTFLRECGGNVPGKDDRWSAPATYALMQRVHQEAYAKDKPAFQEVSLGSGASIRFARSGGAA